MPIAPRGDFDAPGPRAVARIGGVTFRIVRDWVVKFNAHGPDGPIDRKAPGQPSRLNDTHRAALAKIIESGPTPHQRCARNFSHLRQNKQANSHLCGIFVSHMAIGTYCFH